jgi:hypothetical protein
VVGDDAAEGGAGGGGAAKVGGLGEADQDIREDVVGEIQHRHQSFDLVGIPPRR